MPFASPLRIAVRHAIFAAGLASTLFGASAAFADQQADMNRALDYATQVRNQAAQTGLEAEQASNQQDYARACTLFTTSVQQWGDADRALAKAIEAGYFMQVTRESQAIIDSRIADNKQGLRLAESGEREACGYRGSTSDSSQVVDMRRNSAPFYIQALKYENTAKPDPAQLADLYGKSCTAEEVYIGDNGEKLLLVGCINFVDFLRHGTGIAKDSARAAALSQMMCDKKTYIGCGYLADMLYNGEGIPQDRTRALPLYQISCDKRADIAVSCEALGRMYEDGVMVPQDKVKADNYYSKSCDLNIASNGSAFGCYKIGMSFLNKKDDSSMRDAFYYFDIGCKAGQSGLDRSAASCFQVALFIGKGIVHKKDKEWAICTLRRALRIDPTYAPAINQLKQWNSKKYCLDWQS